MIIMYVLYYILYQYYMYILYIYVYMYIYVCICIIRELIIKILPELTHSFLSK